MKFVMHARSGDWHLSPKRSRVWSCGRTMGEALRAMLSNARAHGFVARTMEVEISTDSWTRRALQAPRLLSNTGHVLERVADEDEDGLYFIRDTWTGELHYIARMPPGQYPFPPEMEGGHLAPYTADPFEFEQMEAFGVPMLKTKLPHKWVGAEPPRLLPCRHWSPL